MKFFSYPFSHFIGSRRLGSTLRRAWLGLLWLPAGALFAQEAPVSRAEYEALRQELHTLREEVEQLRLLLRRPPEPPAIAPLPPVIPAGEAPRGVATWDEALTFTEPSGRFSLSVRGVIQPRYEYESREDAPDRSSFSLRRLWLDLRGHAFSRNVTYRIMPELNHAAGLRDGWLEYRLADSASFRFGQFPVPFNWERDMSASRQQLAERSVASTEFEWADGRDIGLMLHGNVADGIHYQAGVFGGEGRNVAVTSSNGLLYAGRITLALLGEALETEALVRPVDMPQVSLGLGTTYANKNRARNWDPFGPAPNRLADVFGATGDLHIQSGRFSTHLAGFYRNVDLGEAGGSYRGSGYNLQAGWLLTSERLHGSFRFGHAQPDRDDPRRRTREILGGLQFFQSGHGAKLHLEFGRQRRFDGARWSETDIYRSQYQILF